MQKKTVLLTNSQKETNISLNGVVIESSEEAIYLGQVIAFSDSLERELKRRKAKAWNSYWSLRDIFKGNFTQEMKRKIFESCVLPVLTYGAQTWAPTDRQLVGLARTQIGMERSMLGVKRKDRVRNLAVRRKSKIVDCRYRIKKLKFDYAGHVIRGEEGRWERKALFWIPRDKKRKVGRPKLRWEDEIIRRVGTAWVKGASDREYWRRVGEANALEWAHDGR